MSTMLESFDTQMLDFQADPDYSMQVSSSEPWFHDEAIMEDDGGHIQMQNTIEVDMEPYDEQQHPEYEMEDDSEAVELDPHDIPDVEVYDASRFQSPHDHENPALSVDLAEPLSIATEYTESSHDTHVMLDSQNIDEITSHVPYHHSPSSYLPEPSNEPATAALHTDEQASSEEIVQLTDDIEGADAPLATDLHDLSGVAAEEPLLDQQNVDEQRRDINLEGEGIELSSIDPATEVSSDHRGDETEPQVEVYEELLEIEGSASDPHEISEGVYIDPPPPVLVSISTELPSISLFNPPSKIDSDSTELVVLLGQLPTLYYEPLSSVFHALRQEEYLGGVPELLNGELLLDAYDLELIMSEDYTYAHELSLHDLNILHDGLNKSGPLRLRLKSVTPRFIDRYHLLQDQIAQFQLAEPPVEIEASATELDVSGAERTLETDAPGAEPATEVELSATENLEHETEKHEGGYPLHPHAESSMTHLRIGDDASPSLDHREDEQEAEQETETFEEQHHAEEENSQEESIVAIAEAHNVEKIHPSEAECTENEDNHDNLHNHEQEDHDAYVDDSHQEDDFVENNGEDISAGGQHAGTDEVHAETSGSVSFQNGGSTESLACDNETEYGLEDAEGIDPPNLDAPVLHDKSDEPDSVQNPDDPHVELELTTDLAQELYQANSLVDAALVNEAQDPDVVEDDSHAPEGYWDDTLDGEGDLDDEEYEQEGHEYNFVPEYEQHEQEEHDTASNLSSATLSSTSAKRSLSEAELEEYVDNDDEPSPRSPDPKRPRI
ncbi:hypothetical protein C0991_009804 [Blastosporella zonata]|nr:hypothetical protein C0991_009804 [Blastosporella zonata]